MIEKAGIPDHRSMFDGLGFLLLQEIFFCRVLDIRVAKIMESDMWQVICLENSGEVCSHETRLDDFTNLIDIDVIKVSNL